MCKGLGSIGIALGATSIFLLVGGAFSFAKDFGGPFDQLKIVEDTPTKVVFRIDKPNVRDRVTEYRQIKFLAGDVVTIEADGCVQTGGSGKTWKRYVFPKGPDSEKLYHGLVWIPGATPALVRIEGVMKKRLLVPRGVKLEDSFLRLGYEDDNYTDNGYHERNNDNGTDDHCKGLGNAYVIVTIERGAIREAAGSTAPLDLIWSEVDDNFIPFAPRWSYELSNPGKLPEAMKLAGGFFQRGNLGSPKPKLNALAKPWTTQPVTIDSAAGINDIISSVHNAPLHGHVNWFPSTYTGSIYWHSHEKPPFGDDDYNLLLVTPAKAGMTVQNEGGLLLEFDTDETIDNFKNGWWDQFHKAVDKGDSHASPLINGKHAIVTGLMGLDVQHEAHAELHPVWAMAIRTEDDALSEKWVMFVRNWGDEGFCSQDQHFLDLIRNEYTFRLPWREGATSAKAVANQSRFWSHPVGLSNPKLHIKPGEDVRISFPLERPEKKTFWYGELQIQWEGGNVKLITSQAGAVSTRALQSQLFPMHT